MSMTTKEVFDKTGISERTIVKYAKILDIPYLSAGKWKVYNWAEADIERLKEATKLGKAKVGRPPKKDTDTG